MQQQPEAPGWAGHWRCSSRSAAEGEVSGAPLVKGRGNRGLLWQHRHPPLFPEPPGDVTGSWNGLGGEGASKVSYSPVPPPGTSPTRPCCSSPIPVLPGASRCCWLRILVAITTEPRCQRSAGLNPLILSCRGGWKTSLPRADEAQLPTKPNIRARRGCSFPSASLPSHSEILV